MKQDFNSSDNDYSDILFGLLLVLPVILAIILIIVLGGNHRFGY